VIKLIIRYFSSKSAKGTHEITSSKRERLVDLPADELEEEQPAVSSSVNFFFVSITATGYK
jgi:hypothetical protein